MEQGAWSKEEDKYLNFRKIKMRQVIPTSEMRRELVSNKIN
jgi:hypothetical protein